jgi:flavin-dependent dehydrogenase
LIVSKDPLIALSGDAAGLTKPWSGGGVVWGLIGAEILLKTFPDFKKYSKSLKRFFLPKIIISKTGIKLVYFFGFKMPWLMPKKITMESDFLL